MKGLISRIWFPATVISALTLQLGMSDVDVKSNDTLIYAFEDAESPFIDTVKYPRDGYKKRWTEEEKAGTFSIADSLLDSGQEEFGDEEALNLRPMALDTLIAPDSLLQLDTFRYKYYAALRDSLCHMYVRDSLIAMGDSLDWPRLDSLYAVDSAAFAEAAYWEWYATLDKAGRKKADFERLIPIKQAQLDSLKAAKDSIQAVKDSILENTPRILESYVFRDSMRYRRILKWTHDQNFHDIKLEEEDTSFRYRFYDYPFQRKDVNATWLGVAGSPVQYFDYSLRKSKENVFFYDSEESWSYTPSTLGMYNTKTPYTELGYSGTILAGSSKESDNLHLMTTQNITPALNICLLFDRFGGEGILDKEKTTNKTSVVSANYLGKKYMMHAGYIHNKISRTENGGIVDNFWIRDTTVDAREISVQLADAKSAINKHTVFLDQQYRIPFYFLEKWMNRKESSDTLLAGEGLPEPVLEAGNEEKETEEDKKTAEASGEDDGTADEQTAASDTLKIDDGDITTAFIGHSSEYSVYKRVYSDNLSKNAEKEFYGNVFNYNPKSSNDSLRVMKFDNKVFLRLQPWAEDGIVSKLDLGIGEKIQNYFTFDNRYINKPSNKLWTATYLYAGVNGKFKKYIEWDALGHYTFLGDEMNDFDISANAKLNIFPFRRHKDSPLSMDAHFSTSLKEPDYYTQHLYTNHYKWDNEFGKISTTTLQFGLTIPRWDLGARVTYNLLANNIYYDESAMVCQNTTAMSVLSAMMYKNFTVGKLHFDHKALFQMSSNEDVIPLPKLAANIRYYIQIPVKDAMKMQLGANVWYYTAWHLPSWSPALGVFHNQKELEYGDSPYVDAFANFQWKRCCLFVKYENANMGWPMKHADYFSANHYIRTTRTVKIGVYWPFYTQPGKDNAQLKSGE